MGVMTVFLTVSFITFLGGLGQLSPLVAFRSAVFHAGDFDVLFRGRFESVKTVISNNNYYVDENEFWRAPYLSDLERVNHQVVQSFGALIPTVNFTQLNEIAENSYSELGQLSPIELFPRWTAQSLLISGEHTTTANMIAGNSSLERLIRVAPDFPNINLGQQDMITSQDVLDILQLQAGD